MTIKLDIQDDAILRAIRPEDATRYLTHHGWRKIKDLHGYQVWDRVFQETLQRIRVPVYLDDSADEEYATYMQKLLRSLADFQACSQIEILDALRGKLQLTYTQ